MKTIITTIFILIFSLVSITASAKMLKMSSEPEGDAFPRDEAGISAYINLSETINLENAIKAFSKVLTIKDSHTIGIIPISQAISIEERGTTEVNVYVDTTGWIVAYLLRDKPASGVIKWSSMDFDKPKIEDFTLTDAIEKLCKEINVHYLEIQDKIKFYHFAYPEAQKMFIFINTAISKNESVQISIPAKYRVYEASYSIIGSASYLYLDENSISSINGYLLGKYDIEKMLIQGVLHTIELRTNGRGGLGSILLYKEW